MEKNEDYQIYASYEVKDVPNEKVKSLIESFMFEASLNMGSNYDARIFDRIIYFIINDFHYLPISYVAMAFLRGSLGKLGPGRLIPRTIYDWLNEVANEYKRLREHKEMEEHYKVRNTGFNLHKFPAGKAILKKIEWLKSGVITEAQWDKIPLIELAGMIADGFNVTPKNFGINGRKDT